MALWWSLHAWAAAAFLRLSLGDFEGRQLGVGKFQTAEMEEVLRFLGVSLNPWIALGLVFLGFFAVALFVRSVWHSILRALRTADLNSVAKEALHWAVGRQLSAGLLVVALVCNGAVFFALWFSQHADLSWAVAVFLLMLYAIPVLIMRPRWLGASRDDHTWIPGSAALGTYVLLVMLGWMLTAGVKALLGELGGLLSFVPALFLIWLAASVLLFVRSASDVRPHLASRMNLRFLTLVVLGSSRPIVFFVMWLLPAFLLALHYSIFIGPSVSQLAPFLPDPISRAHALFSSFANVFSDYWWIASIPLVTVFSNLYVGRCLVVFEGRDSWTSPRKTLVNNAP